VSRRLIAILLAISPALTADVVADTAQALSTGDFARAESIVRADRAVHGETPEALDAASWIARAELMTRRYAAAEAEAKQVRAACAAFLRSHPADSSASLADALGAAIEVRAQAMADTGRRAAALEYLRSEFAAFKTTSVADRIRKNINLLAIDGSAAPALDVAQYLGAKPPSLASLRGRPVLLFFWAHWCGDCKADEPLIAKLAREFEPRGLVVIAPTRLYGYTAQSDSVTPQQELDWTRAVFDRFYSDIPGVTVPVSASNFRAWGASTTPTIAVIDRAGVVRLYHPGAMTEQELRPALERVVAGERAANRAQK